MALEILFATYDSNPANPNATRAGQVVNVYPRSPTVSAVDYFNWVDNDVTPPGIAGLLTPERLKVERHVKRRFKALLDPALDHVMAATKLNVPYWTASSNRVGIDANGVQDFVRIYGSTNGVKQALRNVKVGVPLILSGFTNGGNNRNYVVPTRKVLDGTGVAVDVPVITWLGAVSEAPGAQVTATSDAVILIVEEEQERWDRISASGFYSTRYGSKDLMRYGVVVVDASYQEAQEILEKPFEDAVDPLTQGTEIYKHKGSAWAINFALIGTLGGTSPNTGPEILADWIDPLVTRLPVSHPVTGNPFTLSQVKTALVFP